MNSKYEPDGLVGPFSRRAEAARQAGFRATRPLPVSPPAGPVLPAALRLWATDRRGVWIPTLLVWLLVLIMVLPQGLDFQGLNGMPTSSDLPSRITWLVLLGGGAWMVYQHLARARELARWVNPFMWAFLGLAAASIVWSIEPAITGRRVMRLVTIFLVSIGFATIGWQPRRFQTLLRSILTWLLVCSIVFVILDPEDSVHHSLQAELKDAWKGVTMGKNLLGSSASMAVVLWLHAWIAKQIGALKAFAGIAIAALCLVMCRSATSLMATVFAVGFMLILLRSPGALRRYMPYLVTAFATLILIYCLAVLRLVHGLDFILAPITMLTGKDLTFTGRTAIWEILNEHIRLRPWFGTGYGAYWIGRLPTSPSYEMFTRLYFYPTEGHNGYLDIINDLGAVGGLVMLGYFAAFVRQALVLMRVDRYQGGLYLTLLFRGFIADMSESHWFHALSVDFMLMTLATLAMARSSLQVRLDRLAAQLRPAEAVSPGGR